MKCGTGEYTATAGMIACTSAKPGYMVDKNGASAQTPCPVGTYQPVPKAPSCVSCGKGYTTNGTANYRTDSCIAILYDSLQAYYAVHGNSHKAPGTLVDKPWKCQDGKNWKKSAQACK